MVKTKSTSLEPRTKNHAKFINLSLTQIDPNPYNSRKYYTAESIESMKRSISVVGLLTPVKVRPSPEFKNRFELVYGHRRMVALKQLNIDRIRAEITPATDEEMITQSVIENLDRESLSDFEKALVFEKMHEQFGNTYEQIGKLFGLSKQHVSNTLAMLRLFDESFLRENPDVYEALQKLTEHHARVLYRVRDQKTRGNTAKMVVTDNLSVRDLSHLVGRLRSWFEKKEDQRKDLSLGSERAASDKAKIREVVMNEFSYASSEDFESFRNIHLFEDGFSMYTSIPPLDRVEDSAALAKKREWFSKIIPLLSWHIEGLEIKILGEGAAMATFVVHYEAMHMKKLFKTGSRVTMVLVKRANDWRIIHEHWSSLGEDAGHTRAMMEIENQMKNRKRNDLFH
jgi:ParB family chromosome partitioning protein